MKRNTRLRDAKKMQFFLLYTITSICMIKVCFLYFDVFEKGFGWAIDSLPVQFPMFMELRNSVRESITNIIRHGTLEFPIYDFKLGMGTDTLTCLSMWYLEPIAFVGAFFDYEKMEAVYDFLAVLRIYLAGLSFGAYCLYRKWTKTVPIVCGSLIYVFSGWTFFFLRHPVFYATLIYLPLLFIGVEKILKKKNTVVFLLLVFLSAVTHYYYLYVNTLFIAIYFFIRYWEDIENKTLKNFGSYLYLLISRYLGGVGLAAFTLLPNIIIFLNSNRRNKIIETGSLLHFGDGWGKQILLSLAAADYTPGYFLHNGYAAAGIIFFLICLLKKEVGIGFKIISVLLTIGFAFPFVTFGFHVFSSVHFRWNYIIGFVFGYAAVRILSMADKIKFQEVLALFLFVLLYSGIQAFYPEFSNTNTLCGIFFLLMASVLIFFYTGLKKEYKVRFYHLFVNTVFLLICCNVYYNARYIYSPEFGNYVSEFVDKNSSLDQIIDTSASAMSGREDWEGDFYRVDSANLAVKNENSAIFLKHYGISSYVNVMDQHLAKYNYGLENRGTRLLDTIDNDNRTIMEALASVRYFTIYDGEEAYIPYGYSLREEREASDGRLCKIFENDFFLPLGYTYDKCIYESDYDGLNALEKQETLLQAAVVEDESGLGEKLLHEKKGVTVVEQEPNITISGISCEYDPETKRVKVLQNGGFLTVNFPGKPNCETYVRLNNLNIDEYKDAYWLITLFNDQLNLYKTIEARSNTATYSYGCYDYLINLGYSKDGICSVNIGFPLAGEFALDEIQVFYQPMVDYGEQISILKENTLENISESANEVTGTIDLKKDKLLVLSIPYNKGWTAYVDGQKVDLERVNITYCGLYLEKGKHTIRMQYRTPGWKEGCMISVGTLLVLLVLFVLKHRISSESVSHIFPSIE